MRLFEPDIKLLFRTRSAKQFDPLDLDSECPKVLPASVRFRDPVDGSFVRPWDRFASLSEYATRVDVSPGASDLLYVYRPLDILGSAWGPIRASSAESQFTRPS